MYFDFGVKMSFFAFTPKMKSAGLYFRKKNLFLQHIILFVRINYEGMQIISYVASLKKCIKNNSKKYFFFILVLSDFFPSCSPIIYPQTFNRIIFNDNISHKLCRVSQDLGVKLPNSHYSMLGANFRGNMFHFGIVVLLFYAQPHDLSLYTKPSHSLCLYGSLNIYGEA